MDNSKEYIKMCEKTIELYSIWQRPSEGDIVYDEHILKKPFVYFKGCPISTSVVWLPRQDQLQEMLLLPKNTQFDSIFRLCALFNIFVAVNEVKFDSLEQLWLAFVMKEKYNKVWSDKDWT